MIQTMPEQKEHRLQLLVRYKNYKIGLINVRNWVFLSLIITHWEDIEIASIVTVFCNATKNAINLETMQVIAILLLLLIWPFLSIFFASPLFYIDHFETIVNLSLSGCTTNIYAWLYVPFYEIWNEKKATHLIEIIYATKANERVEKKYTIYK